MKKLLLATAVTGLFFTACQKEDVAPAGDAAASKGGSVTVQAISPVPAVFIKKILAEEFVGTSYGLTPDASFDLMTVAKNYPDNVYAASIHVDDVMTSNAAKYALKTLTTQPLSYPIGVVDRKPFNGNLFIDSKQFDDAVQMLINKPIDCGVAISTNITGNSARIDIHTGFSAPVTANLEVVTYLLEDNILNSNPDFEQTNLLNSTPGNQFFGAGNPIANFEHRSVVRRFLGINSINAANQVTGGSEVFTTWIDLPQKFSGTSTYKILSFIADATTHEVLNVQQCDLGSEKDWN